jgi:hypothetical protein
LNGKWGRGKVLGMERKVWRDKISNLKQNLKEKKLYLNYWTIYIFFASMIKIQLSVKFCSSGSFDPVYPGFPVQMYL